MHKYVILTKVLRKTNGNLFFDGQTKKSTNIAIGALLAICLIPSLILLYILADQLFSLLEPIGQSGYALNLAMFLLSIVIFVFAILLIPSVFYFSNDNETLLTLPLQPQHIFVSKFLICLLYEYLFVFVFMIPVYLAYLSYAQHFLAFVCFGFLTLLLLPIYPLILSSFFTMVLMRFIPFFKNRDRFQIVAGVFALLLSFLFIYQMNQIDTFTQIDMIALLLQGNNSLLNITLYAFPATTFFAKSIVQADVFAFLIACMITLASFIAFYWVGKCFYFKGVIGANQTAGAKKTITKEQYTKVFQKHSIALAYFRKEMRLLMRTPAYFLNCISSALMFPLMFLIFTLMPKGTNMNVYDLKFIMGFLRNVEHLHSYILLLALGSGCFLGAINCISATAISREGSQFSFMKQIPIAYSKQIRYKCSVGILFGMISIILTILPLIFILALPFTTYLLFLGASFLTCIFVNMLAIILDLAKPKLVWESESAAVKQNFSVAIATLVSMFLGMAIIALLFVIDTASITIWALSFFAFFVILTIVVYLAMIRYTEKRCIELS